MVNLSRRDFLTAGTKAAAAAALAWLVQKSNTMAEEDAACPGCNTGTAYEDMEARYSAWNCPQTCARQREEDASW